MAVTTKAEKGAPLAHDEIDENFNVLRQVAQAAEDLATALGGLTTPTKTTVGLGAYPDDPTELPVPTAVVQAIGDKADTLNTDFNVLTHANNVYTLDYDPKQPLYWIDQTANATVQLDSMSKLTNAEVWLYVQKQPGGVTLNFRHKTKVLGVRLIGNPSTDNGAVDVYTIWKGKTRFYIDQQSKGLGTEQAPDAPETLDYVHNFTLTQGQDPDGKLYVKVDFNQHPLAVSYKLICSKNSNTATSPTVFDPTFEYRGNGYKHYGKTSAETNGVIQEGVTYHYGLRLSLPNYDTVWVRGSITIE